MIEQYLSELPGTAPVGGRAESGLGTNLHLPSQLRRALRDVPTRGRVIFLCAESGMGKTDLALRLQRAWESEGIVCEQHSLASCGSAKATTMLRSLAHRESSEMGVRARLIALDDVPAPDECDLERQASALASLASGGRIVLACLHPEAEPLAEEMPDAVCLHSQDLLGDGSADRDGALWPYVHGVPALAQAAEGTASPLEDVAYCSTLADLVSAHLRPSLPSEELRLRLAMLLLGTGDSEELQAIVERMDADALAWLQRDAPLFGIDARAGSFSCAGVFLDAGLEACMLALRPLCDQEPQVVARCVRVLASRGDAHRAALACGLCRTDDFVAIACEWGVEFVCAGEDALVRRALAERRGDDPQPASLDATTVALSAMTDPVSSMERLPVPPLPRAGTPVARCRRRHLELLQACRDLDRGMAPGRAALPREDDDELSRAFVAHIQARRMLLDGRFQDVHELLLNNASRLAPDTLATALLCDDFEIACVLIGTEPTAADSRSFRRARRLICRMQAERLRSYREALEPLLDVLAGRRAHVDLEAAILRAERMGDGAIRAVLLLAAAVADNRPPAQRVRAHVRAQEVHGLAGAGATQYLVEAARLVDALACNELGDPQQLRSLARASNLGVTYDLAMLATSTSAADDPRSPLRIMQRNAYPRDDLWMVNMLCHDFDTISPVFKQNVPRLWLGWARKAVRQTDALSRRAERGLTGPRLAVAGRTRAIQPPHEGPPIELRLLGGFNVTVCGRNVSGRLETHRAKQLLVLLGGVRDHVLTRSEIIDSLWPGHEPEGVRQRLYEATSTARGRLRPKGSESRVIVAGSSKGQLALDMSVIACDVDDFVRLATRALGEGNADEETLVALACDAASLYVGDLFVPNHDGRGIMAARRKELRELFVDVSVAGGRAAVSLGQLAPALRLARRAVEAESMREDAVYLLVEALKLSGRSIDAWDVYRDYAQRLLELSSIPPSRAMRRLVEDVAPTRGYRPVRRKDLPIGQTGPPDNQADAPKVVATRVDGGSPHCREPGAMGARGLDACGSCALPSVRQEIDGCQHATTMGRQQTRDCQYFGRPRVLEGPISSG